MARKALAWTGLIAALALVAPALALAQNAQSLGTVRLTRAVMADGKPLSAGTYTVRISAQAVPTAVGLSNESSTWLEFVQGGEVRGRELASVLDEAEVIKQVVESTPPASGSAKVELLKGGEYLRVWINRGGTHYLVHFAVGGE